MPKTEMERAAPICRRLIRFLKKHGYVDSKKRNERALMEDITAVDMIHVRFEHPDTKDGGTVMLILCNAEEVLSDWSYKEGSQFDKLMDEFSDSIEEPA